MANSNALLVGGLATLIVGSATALGVIGYNDYNTKNTIQDGSDDLIQAYDDKLASLQSGDPENNDNWDGTASAEELNSSTPTKNDDANTVPEGQKSGISEEDNSRDDDGSNKSTSSEKAHTSSLGQKKGISEEDDSRDDDGSRNNNSNSNAGNGTNTNDDKTSNTNKDNDSTTDKNGIQHNSDGSETWDKDAEYNAQLENFTDDDIKNSDADLGELAKFVVGHIRAKSINLNLPLFEGISKEKMSYGGGTLKPNQEVDKNGNFAVAGHNLHTIQNVLFSQVPRLKKYDVVEIDFHGKTAQYQVQSVTIISPYDTAKIQDSEIVKSSSKRILSIITCTNDAQNRYLVRGVQIGKVTNTK